MNRRDLLQLVPLGVLGGLLPRTGRAAGSVLAESSNSGEATTPGLAESSEGSGEVSGSSAEPWASTKNTDGSTEGTGLTTQGTRDLNGWDIAVLLASTATIGTVALILFLAAKDDPHRPIYGDPPPPTPAAALLNSGFLNVRRDLGLILSALAGSPAALDRLAAEARAGSGSELDSLARAANLPSARVAEVVAHRWVPSPTTGEAARVTLGILGDLAPDLAPDPDFVAEALWQLCREQRRARPQGQPVHLRVATWMGVGAEDYGPVMGAALAGLPTRAELHENPCYASATLADTLAAAFPEQVQNRVRWMRDRVAAMNRAFALGWASPTDLGPA